LRIEAMIQVSTASAQQQLPELLAAAERGESVKIEDEKGGTFRLIADPPPATVKGVPKAGRWKGKIIVPDDFDEPLEELREYME
jgi:antitoxin (DNA-binding transcriptional repressor) of toxin-antitoxin stability system